MAELVINTDELRRVGQHFNKVAMAGRRDLLEQLAGVAEAQTKRRILDDKKAPDGTPWKEWSDEYAKTRGNQHSLLVGHGDLHDDIAAEVSGKLSITVFSIREYAGAQDATRPFMGMSKDDAKEFEEVAIDYLADIL